MTTMSTPYGLNAPLYVHSGQSELNTTPYVEPYSASHVIQQSEQQFLWGNLAHHPYGSTVYLNTQPISPMLANTQAHYSALDNEEDKDEFATFGTCVSVRGEQLAYNPMQAGVTYQSSQNPGTLDILTTDADDTLSNPPLDGPLEDEEHIAVNMQNGQAHESEYSRMLLREDDMSRGQNMQYSPTNGEHEPGEEVEEIIEEEIHTVKHGRPAPVVPSKKTMEHIQRQNEVIQRSRSRNREISDMTRVNPRRHHMIDLDAPVISESQFPARYWSRLEELFRSRFEANRPVTRELAVQANEVTHRTTATMATPSSAARERRCFGVSVCPSTQSVGVSCPRTATREFGCTPIETESVIHDWVENKLIGTNEATTKLVQKLFKSSMRSHEEFLEDILHLVKRDTHNVGVQIKPEQRSQFACTKSESVVSTASGDESPMDRSNTESKMVEARPTLTNRSTLTRHSTGPSVACETESPLLRSQGSQAAPDVPDVTCCGIQVGRTSHMIDQSLDPIDLHTRRVAIGTQATLETSETVILTQSSEEIERFWRSRSGKRATSTEQTDGNATKIQTARSSSQSSLQQSGASVVKDNVVPQASGHETRPGRQQSPSKRHESPTETPSTGTRTAKVSAESPSIIRRHRIRSGGEQVSESLRQSNPYWTNPEGTAESFTVSTERRVIDELSQRHLLPSDVDLNELTRGGPEAMDAALRRSKDLGTTHVVREFPPEVEVVRHADDSSSPCPPYLSTLSESMFTEHLCGDTNQSVNPESEASTVVYQIPVMHDTETSPDSNNTPRVIPVEQANEGYRTSLAVHVDSPVFSGTARDSSVPSVTESNMSKSQESSSIVKTPRRNYSFQLHTEALNACEVLTEHYRSNRSVTCSDTAKEEMEKLRTIWFDLTSTTKVELNKLEDFIAILHGYHEHLLRDVMQSVDDNGSTSLHYAVGHSAWPVVNLILDSGYAEPDRLNRAGFSPIMIATVCNVSDCAALRTLDRLFSAGNVNLRAHTNTQQTPLMLAAVNGSQVVLTLLLQHGAQVNLQDTSGNTALMFALEHGDMQVIRTLLDRPDLNLTLRDNDGKNALEIAESKGNTIARDMIKRIMADNSRAYSESVTTTTTTTTTSKQYH